MKSLLTSLLCCALAAPGMAEEWYLCAANENVVGLIETSQIERNNGFAATWLLFINKPGTANHDYEIMRLEFDCGHNKVRITDSIEYLKDKPTNARRSSTPWRHIAPGTMASSNKALACDGVAPEGELITDTVQEMVADFQKLLRLGI